MKEVLNRRTRTLHFFLYEVREQAKLINVWQKKIKIIIASKEWRQALAGKTHERTFKTDDILIGDLGYTGV